MRFCKLLMGSALVFSSLSAMRVSGEKAVITDARRLGSEATSNEALANLPLPPATERVIKGDRLLSSAYYDTFSILDNSNRCSEFFGGPTFAVGVLNQLVSRIRKDYLYKFIAMRMSGDLTYGIDEKSSQHYRLFEKVKINEDGPFYRRRLPLTGFSLPNVGTFDPGTREARTLILLHELGHMIEGADGKWLLPDDGSDDELSKENSRAIERACGDQILDVGKSARAVTAAAKANNSDTVNSLAGGSGSSP